MNLKDKLTRKLLETGKKHRLLVYPTLALVAIITAISHAVYWGRGNGKRFVASAMIMVMLLTQSLFLTSSANVTTDEGQVGETTEVVEIPSEIDMDTTEEVQLVTDETTMDIMSADEVQQLVTDTTEEVESTNSPEDGEQAEESDTTEAVVEDDTTDANAPANTTNLGNLQNTQTNLLGEGTTVGHTIKLYRVDENGKTWVVSYNLVDDQYVDNGNNTVSFYVPTTQQVIQWAMPGQDPSNFSCLGVYTSASCSDVNIAGGVRTFNKIDNGIYSLYFKITREKYPVNINVAGETITDVCLVESGRLEGDINPTATYVVQEATAYPFTQTSNGGAYDWGQTYKGLEYNGIEYTLDGNRNIQITSLEENLTAVNMKAIWEPQLVTVNYDYVGDADTHISVDAGEGDTKTYIYNQDITPINNTEVISTNDGYYLSGWTDGSDIIYPADGTTKVNSSELVTKGSDITASQNMIGKTLTGIWSYKDNELVATGTATAGETSVSIVGTYGDKIDCTISAKYKIEGTANFGLLIADSDIVSLNNNYGLSIKANTSDDGKVTSYRITGTLENITDAAGLSIPLTLIDYNKPSANQTYARSINIVSNKKEVTIDPSTIKHNNHDGIPSKPYDGNTNIVINPKASVKGYIDGDDVYVTFDANATLDDKNAGDNKAITLTGVTLTGNDAGMYILTDFIDGTTTVRVDGIASVTRIAVSVVTSLAEGSSSSILFGQQTPVYTVDIVNPNLLAPEDKARYDACDSQAAKEAFMRQYIGFTGNWDTTRTLYSPTGKYTITPTFSDVDVNYSVSATGVTSEFTVGRESGDDKYKLSPEPINNYYPSLTVTATGGTYDQIRLITDNSDIAEGANPADVVGMFSNSITITEDMTNGTIMFQMMDVDTGAITKPVTLTGINIDSTGPELVSYSVSPNVSYFNEFGFGAYYHSQTIDGLLVESVNITFEYTTSDSECDKLVYYFTDEYGNIKSEFQGKHDLVKNVNGNYTATVTIGTGVSGQLVVYALDTTGNPSVQSKVKLREAINYIKEGQSAQNYYEWMIENTINSADIVVTDANGGGVTSEVWYNCLNFNVLASDSESGVNKIVWSITDPTGATSSITENAHDSVSMVIDGTKEGEATSYGKLIAYDFNTSISGEEALTGEYSASAVLYDNAGNKVVLDEKGPFLFDGKAPTITCDDYKAEGDEYLSGVIFEFTVTEGNNESGVATVQLYSGTESADTLVGTWGPLESYSKEITANGTYIVIATDVAGNVARKEVEFSGISDVVPEVPVISVDGIIGNDNWYIEEMPTVTILSQDKTSDGVPVTTTYKLTFGNNQIQSTVESEEEKLEINNEGEILVEAWSKSKADCLSETASKTVKIDVNGPEITITDSYVDDAGNTVINFTVTDKVSGVNPEKIFVNDEPVEVKNVEGVITGSFIADANQTYSIKAEDIAGNLSEDTEFTPLTLKASPVINITPTGAFLQAWVYEGTYPISDCYIAYKKASQSDYDTALSNKHKESYGISMDYTFRNLDSNTVYDYRVYAIAANSNEVQVIEGSFRTADLKSTATVYGKVTYADDLPDTYKTYPVYVALYDANTVIAGVELETEDDVDYIFKNVADGHYRIVATNGVLCEVGTVTVTNGGISYPTDYATNGGVNFVLDGFSTDVVVKDNSINITADGLDKIYNTALYNGNVTDEDLAVVAAGGTIDITLYASYITVSDVDKTTESIFIDKLGKNGVIEKYIELNVIKEVRDADGKLVNGTPTNITRLAEPITVSFPLGELSGQKIYVASVHESGSDYTYVNWAGSDVTLSQNYVTISTDRFSVYALYRIIETKKVEYTVKWVDGNGNVMKTEKVVKGSAATPPEETPTKAETDKYTYSFSGWDTDYSSINKDTIISAWFVANKKTVNPPSTDVPSDTNKPSNNGTNKEPTKYPYMGSGVSPQTGDETPIIALVMLMFVSATGMILMAKRRKED